MNQTSSKLLIEEEPLQVLPSLAVKLGLNCAMFLQQVHYWLKHSKHEHDGRKWIYNTYEAWHEQFPFWSTQIIRKRIVKPLEDSGVLITTTEYNAMPMDKTKWYAIDYQKLDEMMVASFVLPDDAAKRPDDAAKRPDDADKMTTGAGQNDHTRTGQNDHTNNQRIQETTTESSRRASEEAREEPKANQFVAQWCERITQDCSGIYSESEKGRFARDVGNALKRGVSAEEIDEAIDRIIGRWDSIHLPLSEAIKDVSNGYSGSERPAPKEQSPTANTAYAHYNDWTGGKRH